MIYKARLSVHLLALEIVPTCTVLDLLRRSTFISFNTVSVFIGSRTKISSGKVYCLVK